jgi:hypothetical protein
VGRKREPTPQEVLAEWVARAGLPTFYEQVVDEYLCTLGTDRRGPSRVALCTPCSPLAPRPSPLPNGHMATVFHARWLGAQWQAPCKPLAVFAP